MEIELKIENMKNGKEIRYERMYGIVNISNAVVYVVYRLTWISLNLPGGFVELPPYEN